MHCGPKKGPKTVSKLPYTQTKLESVLEFMQAPLALGGPR